ncbi:MAG: UvrD-helicase domain-containing protein, partial [Deltaproteobacteria bacterium]|nr:UvrD-helicase domain-containing protein [Deltaproteobacteria bacterium]
MSNAMDLIDVCLDFSSSYHVAAGAGTGKTTILTRRALSFLLAADENGPERLLCMTFTRNATAEMRKRIKDELEAVIKLLDGELAREAAAGKYNFLPMLIDEMISRGFGDAGALLRRARHAIANLDLAVMSTLHSFCGDVIREFPIQAGVVSDFAIDDDGIAENDMNGDALHGYLFSLLNAEKLGQEDTLFLAGQFKTGEISEIFLRAASGREISDFLEKTAAAMKSEIFIKRGNKYVVESADAMETAGKIALLAADFASSSNALFHGSGMISYDDMLVKCRRLLKENRRVRDIYKSRFGAVLVDELQDTDPAQFDVIYALGEAPGSFSSELRNVRFSGGKVFLVGDPKQSIYRFRGADIEIYKDMLSVIRKSGAFREFKIDVNHRSHKGILDIVNAVFSKEMEDDYSPIFPGPGKEKPVEGGEVEFFIPSKRPDGGILNADTAREVMTVRIGRWIEENAGQGKRFRYGDVSILTRNATENQIRHLVSVMKMLAIPYIFEGSRSFFLSQEIRDMVNFLKAAVFPEDKKSLIGFLRSPICAFPDSAILLLASEGLLDYRTAEIGGDLKAKDGVFEEADYIYGKLRRAHSLSTALPIEEFVETLFALFSVSSVYSCPEWRHGESGNVEKFKRKVIDLGRTGMTLRAAIDAVAEMMKDELKEAEYPAVDETVDAVRIRTVHSAKGLEFPVVIIFDYGSRKNAKMPCVIADRKNERCFLKLNNNDGRRYFASAGYIAHYTDTFRKIEEAEEVRVNYVAMTRAKEKLLVFGNMWKKSGRGISKNGDMDSALESLGTDT